jgi:hypothetical protein
MKELVRQHFGSIVLAAAILLAVIIHAVITRYLPVTAGGFAYVLDRWTGKTESQ